MQSKALSKAIEAYQRYMAKNDELTNILYCDQSLEKINSLKGFLPFISFFDMRVAQASLGDTDAAEFVLSRFAIDANRGVELDPAILGYVGNAIEKILNNETPKIALGLSPKKGRKKSSRRTGNRDYEICNAIVEERLKGTGYLVAVSTVAENANVSLGTAKKAYKKYKGLFPVTSKLSKRRVY